MAPSHRALRALALVLLCLWSLEYRPRVAAQNEAVGTKTGLKHLPIFPPMAIDVAEPSSIVLPRLDGVEVGHVRSIRVPTFEGNNPGSRTHILQVKTLSLQPLVFEIPHFLTTWECKQLREWALAYGLEDSPGVNADQVEEPVDPNAPTEDVAEESFAEVDEDGDDLVSPAELRDFFHVNNDVAMPMDDIEQLILSMNLDLNEDGFLDRSEFTSVDPKLVRDYVLNYGHLNPSSRHRHSQHVYINDMVGETEIKRIRKRISLVTEIPEMFVMKSEQTQVVKYGQGGHYNCHLDSSETSLSTADDSEADGEKKEGGGKQEGGGGNDGDPLPCCQIVFDVQQSRPCRKCRYATVMIYLTDVSDGGHTAFLAAGKPEINTNKSLQNAFLRQRKGQCNLTASCDGLTVQPERGKALLFYNHLPPPPPAGEQGPILNVGPLDYSTIHGGCDVTVGDKWIANYWINYEFYQQDPGEGYGENWGLEEEPPPMPTPQRQMFASIIGERTDGGDGPEVDEEEQMEQQPPPQPERSIHPGNTPEKKEWKRHSANAHEEL